MKRHLLPMLEPLETRTLMSLMVKTALLTNTLGPDGTVITSPLPTPTPVVGTGTGLTLNLTAGVPFSGQVAFYPSPVLDPPLAYSASINWGDGTTSAATLAYGTQGTTGGYRINATHTYTSPGTFKIVTTVMTGPITTAVPPPMLFATRIVALIVGKAIVAPPPPTPTSGVTIHETAGQPFTAGLGSFVILAPGTGLSAAIAWGDGSSSTGQLKPVGVVGLDQIRFEVMGTHTYAQAGTYPIHVIVSKIAPTPVATAPVIVANIQSLAIVTSHTALSLAGTLTGTYTMPPLASPDAGRTFIFAGTGNAGDLGDVSLQGIVRMPGFIASGQPAGTITLTNALGSVTLTLSGLAIPAFGTLPATFNYVLTQATGAYIGDSATGTLTLTLIPASTATGDNRFTMVLT